MTKRGFLRTIGVGVPTLKLMPSGLMASGSAAVAAPPPTGTKFTTIDCSRYFTASAANLGPRESAKPLAGPVSQDGLIRTPSGHQNFRGIPFTLGSGDVGKKSWIVLSSRGNPCCTPSVEIPIGRKAGYLCLAQFCDWDENESPTPGVKVLEKVGQHLADVVMLYEDGAQQVHPIRRRFEVSALSCIWGHLCFAAVPHRQSVPSKLTDPLRDAQHWGDLQLGLWDTEYAGSPYLDYWGTLWVCALANPSPNLVIKSLRLEAKAEDPVMICGITAYHGRENPLRYARLKLYRITLPEAAPPGEWEVGVDLGVVARTFQLPPFKPEAWLSSPVIGLGEPQESDQNKYVYAEVSASDEATLALKNIKTGSHFDFPLGELITGRELEARARGVCVEILDPQKVWVDARVLDASTGQPTPVRLAFRSKEGRYIPPYGHRTEINNGWFQNYGADLKIGESSFAYVDGRFRVELPVGEVYLEITKGFEYEPVRKKLQITPDQRELKLEVSRFADFRSKNWVCADNHVHFLSPTTAILEGQAEGLNLINVLAAQLADLFTNVGDLSHGPLTSSDGEMVVWVGTENRQHILGHLGLLGSHGEPVFPMSAGGPDESYFGDPLWCTLSDWADVCRKREGLVMAAHFPYPTGEVAADIILDKIDAVELWPVSMDEQFNNLPFQDWYRYLNCGYRLPAVAGTDKMSARIATGAYRGYAYLGQDEFSFASWAKAVRKGNTFVTSGPLLLFEADGRSPGDEITFRTGRGSVEVRVEAKSVLPIHRLEVVLNGKVVASREETSGAKQMTLRETIEVSGPGWLAARCASRIVFKDARDARIAAHTSPVYLLVPGQGLFSPAAAAYMLTLIDGAEAWVKDLATRPEAERFSQIVRVFNDARERLHGRMHRLGIAH